MNNILRILLSCVLISCNQSVNTNAIACKKVEEQLLIIHDFVVNPYGEFPGVVRPDAVEFLEKLTGILSKSPGSDLGKLDPTPLDYIKWEDWFKANKERLDWDAQKMEVVIKAVP